MAQKRAEKSAAKALKKQTKMMVHKVKQTRIVVSQAKKAAPKALRASRAVQAIQVVEEVEVVEQANSRGRTIVLLQRFKS